MNEDTAYQRSFAPYPSGNKNKIVLLAIAGFLILFLSVLIILLLRGTTGTGSETASATPTPFQASRTIPGMTTVSSNQVARTVNKTVKNLHWLTNDELAYTFYDAGQKRTFVAKTNEKQETLLSQNTKLKIIETAWAKNNNAVVLELTYPIKTYLKRNTDSLELTTLSGFAYSWSPDSTRLFYRDTTNESRYVPSFYSVQDKTSTPLSVSLPDFTHSLWSPDGQYILLYTNTFDAHDNDPYLFHTQTNQVQALPTEELLFPAWSPSGEQLAYFSDKGLVVRNMNGAENVVYQPNFSQMSTFTWVDDQLLIVVDSSADKTKIMSISLLPQRNNEIMRNISLATDQRVETALSPDKKTLALATEKNGLLFVTLE